MKMMKCLNLLVSGLVLMVAAVGCKHKSDYGVTKLPEPGTTGKSVGDATPGAPITGDGEKIRTEDLAHPFAPPDARKDWARDREIFKADTVYFDYDSTVIKASEKVKVSAVADKLKSSPLDAVEIDGHADERGTEEYNRALGERRALALREELIHLGIDGTRVDTLTYGKDRPADPGHTEAAHRKNRRGEFLLEKSPK
jgi:peptidoglycan-associated lipoprotein